MIVMCSGGFDPLHVGHLDLIEIAAGYGQVYVALNSDRWLEKKKYYVFMPYEERRRVMAALRDVREVIPVDDADGTVCAALRALRPSYFINGGDRAKADPREADTCRALGVTMIFAGDKIQSSTDLVDEACRYLTS